MRLAAEDRELIEAARETLKRAYRPIRHTVAAAVRAGSGRVYVGVNVEACGYGPCAEPIAIGAAFTHAETSLLTVVAVCRQGDEYPVLSPCGNCRQLILDYAPDARVIVAEGGMLRTYIARELLPAAYRSELSG
jgi:cytidine deaminase